MRFLAKNCDLLFALRLFTTVYTQFMLGSGMMKSQYISYSIINGTVLERLLHTKTTFSKRGLNRACFESPPHKLTMDIAHCFLLISIFYFMTKVRVNFRFSYDDDIYNIMQQAYFFACKYRCSCSRRVNALERHRYQEYKSKQIVFGSWRL
uniref:Uncharacterized protein n=1 Tax=Glossina palpalis gambiensis TaxID=67801 RepID=A0A1B0AW39_9MUSC